MSDQWGQAIKETPVAADRQYQSSAASGELLTNPDSLRNSARAQSGPKNRVQTTSSVGSTSTLARKAWMIETAVMNPTAGGR